MPFTPAQRAAGYYARKRRRARAEEIAFDLTGNTIDASAANGTWIGAFNVRNGSGTYTFTLTDNAGGLFSLSTAELRKAGALAAGTRYLVVAEADNGVDDPISKSFIIKAT